MGEIRQSLVIIGLKGKRRAMALLDSGASENFVSKRLADKIGLISFGTYAFILADGRKMIGYKSSAILDVKKRSGETKVVIVDFLPQDGYDIVLGQRF